LTQIYFSLDYHRHDNGAYINIWKHCENIVHCEAHVSTNKIYGTGDKALTTQRKTSIAKVAIACASP